MLERIEGVILLALISFGAGVIVLNVKNEVVATISMILFCFCQGIVLHRIGRHGQKISNEIKDFKENRNTLLSSESTSIQKETAAGKMLNFKDIKKGDLLLIFENTVDSSKVNALAWDKLSEMNKRGELQDLD